MEIDLLGIDLAKRVFQLHGADVRGRAVYRNKVSRAALIDTVRALRPAQSRWKRVARPITGRDVSSKQVSRFASSVPTTLRRSLKRTGMTATTRKLSSRPRPGRP